MIIDKIKERKGEGYIDTVIIVFVVVLMIAFASSVLPVFMQKSKLDTLADEMVRYVEVCGKIDSDTDEFSERLKIEKGINPKEVWSKRGAIQLNEEFSLVLEMKTDIGFFSFGSYPITLTTKSTGRSEVYWK